MMQWGALLGGALILVCQYFVNSPFQIYAKSEYWLNHPAQILTKVGVTLLMLSVAFVWTRYGARQGGWSFVRQFGITSLLVYWVHIELVYGRWLFFMKDRLTVPQTVVSGGHCDSADADPFVDPDQLGKGEGRARRHGLARPSQAAPRGRGLKPS